MKEKVVLDEGDLAVLDMIEDPVVFGEFVRSTDEEIEDGGSWKFNNYQKLMILDESSYISVCTGRTTGKTVSLETKIVHTAVSNKYRKASANEVVLVVQNKAQLSPVFLRLTQFFRRHPLLKHFVDRYSINFSEYLIKLLNGATIRCRIVGSSADSNIIGLHNPCILVDEAQVFNYVAWNSLGQCLTQWDEGFQMWISGVPNGLREKNILYEADQLDEKWSRYNVSRTQSPRYTEEQHKSDLKQYGGEEGDDYIHLVLGQHGLPAFSVFDRKLMKIESYDVVLGMLNNLTLEHAGGRFYEVLKAPDMIGIKADLLACYSSDTEVLTNSGWKLFKDLSVDDKIATLNHNKLEYQLPTNYISYDYSGKMCNVDSRFIDLLVTPNHKLYVSHKNKGSYLNKKYELVNAENVFDKSLRFKNTCCFDGNSLYQWSVPGYTVKYVNRWGSENIVKLDSLILDTIDFIEFMGYFISEGSLGRGKVVISQSKSKNINNYDKIESCIKRLSFKYSNNENGFCIYNTQLSRYLESFGMVDSYHKYIPREMLDLSVDLLKVLFDALMLGDGYSRDNTYSTTSKLLSDNFQELIIRLGYSGSISIRNNVGKCRRLKAGRDIMTKGLTYIVNFQTKYLDPQLNTRGVNHTSWVDYNDTVYCVDVPNHIILVRRNGKPVWCGNCAVDAGFSNDPTIITILYRQENLWRIFLRYELRRIKYPMQAKIINWLDNIYGFNMITLDAGSSGLALGQMLQDLDEFKDKDYQKRLTLVDFQGGVVTGYTDDGKETKDRVRKFTIQTLQKWSQNDQIIVFSDKDDEMLSELERVGFTRDMLGQPKFFVYSPMGGQRGDDHILASLLTWVYGYYYEYYSPEKPKTKGKYGDLAKGGWNAR